MIQTEATLFVLAANKEGENFAFGYSLIMSLAGQTGRQEQGQKLAASSCGLASIHPKRAKRVANVNEKEQAAKLRIPTWRRIAHQGAGPDTHATLQHTHAL